MKNNRDKIITIIGIVVIVILTFIILVSTGTIRFKHETSALDYTDNLNRYPVVENNDTEKKDNEVEENDSIDERPILNNNIEFNKEIKTTEDIVKIDDEMYATIKILDGKLSVTSSRYVNNRLDDSYVSESKTFTINNEKVKYITSTYYQPSDGTYIILLTESGNVYYSSFR